jgi:thioredoxin reductase
MHHAQLHNYLGAPHIRGSEFQAVARQQVVDIGAEIRADKVAAVTAMEDGRFRLRAGHESIAGDYVVLAGGKRAQRLAKELGAEVLDGRVLVDGEYRTRRGAHRPTDLPA